MSEDTVLHLVTSSATLLDILTQDDGIQCLRKIEYCGRVSHRSEDAQTADSWERFITSVVLGRGDWSIVEHVSATVDATIDRGISHEWVRHRLFGYTQSSTRFINYTKGAPPAFVCPGGLTAEEERQWTVAIAMAEITYRALIEQGVAPQIARSVFPNALATRLITSGNLRNWRHFFLMRTTKETHPQMREVTIPLLAQFQERIPLLYADITPLARQAENLARPR